MYYSSHNPQSMLTFIVMSYTQQKRSKGNATYVAYCMKVCQDFSMGNCTKQLVSQNFSISIIIFNYLFFSFLLKAHTFVNLSQSPNVLLHLLID